MSKLVTARALTVRGAGIVTARRVADALRKAGKSLTPEFDTDHEDTDAFAESQAALALCYASAARGVDITGERAGQPSLRRECPVPC